MKKISGMIASMVALSMMAACGTPAKDGETGGQGKARQENVQPAEKEGGSESTKETTKEAAIETTKETQAPEATWELSQAGTIEETVLYNENDVVITATELRYEKRRVEVVLEFENNSDRDFRITAETLGYSCNAVNGYMIEDGYVNVDVAAGKKASDTCSFKNEQLLLFGITEIADIELGFDISDDDYNDIYTGPLRLETSLAETHDYDADIYRDSVMSANAINTYDYEIDMFSEEVLFEQNGIRLLSEMLITNTDGDQKLFLEFENTSDEMVHIQTNDIAINGLTVISGRWSSDTVIPGHEVIASISLDNLADQEVMELFDISEIGEIRMNISLSDMEYNDISEGEEIIISTAGKNYYSDSGTELYDENGVQIIYKGSYQESEAYSQDIHIILLVKNQRDGKIRVDDEYNSFSINEYMSDCSCYSKTIGNGSAAVFDIEVSDYYFEDAKIEKLEDIITAEIILEIKDGNYKDLDKAALVIQVK